MALIFVLLGLIFLMIMIAAYKRTKQNPSHPNQPTDNSTVPILSGGDTSGHGKSKGGSSEPGGSDHSSEGSGDSGGDGGGGGGGD
ncbi:hypothetical protein D3P09_03480 [Paenibacillus pinisoli]|uniref:Uncharacterized protein n=1 Tax=Paenibacillus pinisoli TaxID=1276110 RepID=A0A3A6PL38_9BACL|nr:hypothetical protein [Paenibacillus pinisoli]RJX41080.1 hypothetical protein D3P09_03480 [Paenibacillus pinisoli]